MLRKRGKVSQLDRSGGSHELQIPVVLLVVVVLPLVEVVVILYGVQVRQEVVLAAGSCTVAVPVRVGYRE